MGHSGIPAAPSLVEAPLSTDVQPRGPRYPAIARTVHALAEIVGEDAQQSNADFVNDLMETLLGAETEEDLWRSQDSGTTSGKEYAGRPFMLRSFDVAWRRSRQTYIDQGGFPFFFFAKVWDLESQTFRTINCGGKTIVCMMYKLLQLNAIQPHDEDGGRMFVIESHPSEQDYDFLTIHPYAPPTAPAANGRGRKAA